MGQHPNYTAMMFHTLYYAVPTSLPAGPTENYFLQACKYEFEGSTSTVATLTKGRAPEVRD